MGGGHPREVSMRLDRAPLWLEVLQFVLGAAVLVAGFSTGRAGIIAIAVFFLVVASVRSIRNRRR